MKLGLDSVVHGKKVNISGRLTILYILALSAVACLTITGQFLIQYSINDQMHDGKVVNYTGRQRFQSQGMVKSIMLLTDPSQAGKIDRNLYINQLKKFYKNWSDFHWILKKGYWEEFDIHISRSDTILRMLSDLEPDFTVMNEQISRQIGFIDSNRYVSDTAVKASLMKILAVETPFLNKMDRIVFQYDIEAAEKVNKLKQIERILMIITLIILVLEGIFIFRPAVYQIKGTIQKLQESERRTNTINEDLKLMNDSLKKAEDELLEATRQKYHQQLHEQKVKSVSLIQGQESERKRIARELHDGIGQMLTAIKINSDRISNSSQLTEKDKKSLEDLKSLISDTLGEVKNISFNLMPAVLTDFGLVPALKILTDRVAQNAKIIVQFTTDLDLTDEDDRLEKNLEVGIYRIAQEAINNAVKYAEATEIKIDLSEKSGFIFLNISDNGKGFSRKRITEGQWKEKNFSTGLNSMEERTNMFNGEFRIASTIGKGTKIYVKLPLKFQDI